MSEHGGEPQVGPLGAVAVVAARRVRASWVGVGVVGVLLGLGFGLSFASFAAAGRTSSSYDRVLEQADAPDAAVALGRSAHQGEQVLRTVDEITDQRVYVGFTGRAEGVDPLLTSGLLAPTRDRFPLELPQISEGRLPDPDAPDEVFVNSSAADRGGLEVGQRLHFHFASGAASNEPAADLTIVGIGTLPVEAVADETMVLGVLVSTRAFYEAHREFAVYSVSNVDLAPGVDARRTIAATAGGLGFQLQSDRSQERQAVDRALRPLVSVLVALGVLAFAGTAVAAALVIQRSRAASASEDATLLTIGMTRGQIRLISLARSGVMAVVAVVVALVTMVAGSPIAPVGPLHELDPAQGVGLDALVAATGATVVLVMIGVLTVAFSPRVRRPRERAAVTRGSWLTATSGRPSTMVGLALARRADEGRARSWRVLGGTTAATLLVAVAATFAASAVALTNTASRYGFDADLLALNAYGDQDPSALERAFGTRPDVEAATGFTGGSFLVDGRAVPGVAATSVKGELFPTILSGSPPRTDAEVVLGQETLDDIDADVGDVVPVQLFVPSGPTRDPAGRPVELRIVGVATFPAVNQMGSDTPRLGIGALLTHEALARMQGDGTDTNVPAGMLVENHPEFTSVRLVDGADPADVIADNPDGFTDREQTTTSWFTDAKPAELRQLDAAMPYLQGGLLVGYLILVAVMVHALLARSRANRHDLAVFHAIGATRPEVDAVTAWQVAPFALAAVLIGVPVGVLLGRRAFSSFARSLAVVDTASTSVWMLAALVGAVLFAAAVGGVAAVLAARRSRAAVVLREG